MPSPGAGTDMTSWLAASAVALSALVASAPLSLDRLPRQSRGTVQRPDADDAHGTVTLETTVVSCDRPAPAVSAAPTDTPSPAAGRRASVFTLSAWIRPVAPSFVRTPNGAPPHVARRRAERTATAGRPPPV